MAEDVVDLGVVTAPSGVLVLGMAGWLDYWPQLGDTLAQRATAAAAEGGGHLHDWMCEAVAVPAAADQPLPVRATTTPSPFYGRPAIATLEIDLGLPYPSTGASSAPLPLEDLPVDRCGMVLGDARALDVWTGIHSTGCDGLADVTYWGKDAEPAQARFGGETIHHRYGEGPRGWLDLPAAQAKELEAALTAWEKAEPGRCLKVGVEQHTDYYRLCRAGWDHPLRAGTIEVAGCPVLGIAWDQGDHAMRHNGERAYGKAYPVTLHTDRNSRSVLRWSIPPYAAPEDPA